ncbi:hypothetical protein EJB05_57461, partial [Eragrostis curvula]
MSSRWRSGWSSPACASCGRCGSGARAELLPAGFDSRVAASGVVRAGWPPQEPVLAHAAFGAFMTHAGLSSVVEASRACCLAAVSCCYRRSGIRGQGHTARAMAARRVSLQVPHHDDDGSFAAADVAAAMGRVMMADREEGEVREVLRDGVRPERYVDELAESLRQLAGKYYGLSNFQVAFISCKILEFVSTFKKHFSLFAILIAKKNDVKQPRHDAVCLAITIKLWPHR